MFYRRLSVLSVCLSVSINFIKTYWTSWKFTRYVFLEKEELITFRKIRIYESFDGVFNIARQRCSWGICLQCTYVCVRACVIRCGLFDKIFPQFGSCLWKNWSNVCKIFCTRKCQLNFGRHPDPDSRSGLQIQTCFALAEVCAIQVLSLL